MSENSWSCYSMHLKYLGVHIILRLRRFLADELHTVNRLRSYFDRISSYIHFIIDCIFSSHTCNNMIMYYVYIHFQTCVTCILEVIIPT